MDSEGPTSTTSRRCSSSCPSAPTAHCPTAPSCAPTRRWCGSTAMPAKPRCWPACATSRSSGTSTRSAGRCFAACSKSDGQLTGFESEVWRHKTRERIWISENAHVVRDAAGRVRYLRGHGRRDHRRASWPSRRCVRTSELLEACAGEHRRRRLGLERGQRRRGLFAAVQGAVRLCRRRTGRDRPEALDSLTHPEDVERMRRDREDHFAGRTPAYVNEHRVLCKDGQWKWILSRGIVISRDAAGGRCAWSAPTPTSPAPSRPRHCASSATARRRPTRPSRTSCRASATNCARR